MNIKLTADLAALLIQQKFGLTKDEFFVTGSLVVGSDLAKEQADDIDFCIERPAFDRLSSHNWRESEYFVGEGYKTAIDGITFNAVVLSSTEYEVWKKTTETMAKTPIHIKGRTKQERCAAFEFFLSHFRGS